MWQGCIWGENVEGVAKLRTQLLQPIVELWNLMNFQNWRFTFFSWKWQKLKKKKSKIGDFDFVISKQSGRYPIQNIHKNTPQILRMPDIIRFGPSFGWFLSLYVVYDPSQNRVFATSHVFGALYQNYIKKFQLLLPQLLRSWDNKQVLYKLISDFRIAA